MSTASPVRQQLALNLRLRDASSFENFFQGRNRESFGQVRAAAPMRRDVAASAWLYLWGESGTGKTHLLEAACRGAQETGAAPAYVPLRDKTTLAPGLREDKQQTRFVCIDNAEAIAGDLDWERALFALYERLRAAGGMLIVGARHSPAALGLALPDLATRFAAGLVYQLHPLTDEDKAAALRLRASRRGLEMTEEVAGYLITRYPRDPHSLFALLDRLDDATLAAQRRLTIPFLRSLAGGG
jgi:DnaA family protein